MSFKKLIAASMLAMFTAGIAIAQPIVGIGDLKIGMSEQEFLGISDVKGKDIRDVTARGPRDFLNYRHGKDTGVVWKQNDKSAVNDFEKIYTHDVVKYQFVMPLGVNSIHGSSYGVDLLFRGGKLISITVIAIGLEFEDLLANKYGKPVQEKDLQKITCQNGYGAKSEHLNGTRVSKWGTGKPIVASVHWQFADCGESVMASYFIGDMAADLEVHLLENKAQMAARDAESKRKAASSRL